MFMERAESDVPDLLDTGTIICQLLTNHSELIWQQKQYWIIHHLLNQLQLLFTNYSFLPNFKYLIFPSSCQSLLADISSAEGTYYLCCVDVQYILISGCYVPSVICHGVSQRAQMACETKTPDLLMLNPWQNINISATKNANTVKKSAFNISRVVCANCGLYVNKL